MGDQALELKKCHSEWRRLAKKLRRKRIRQKLALERDKKLADMENTPAYLTWLANKLMMEEIQLEEEERLRNERNEKWLKDEEDAQRQWREQQRLKALAEAERKKEQQRIREEWELQQKKIKEKKEEESRREEEELKKRQRLFQKIDDFVSTGGVIPEELLIVTESHPGEPPCPFYSKLGACRFRNRCSRNHAQPGISRFILFPNFYSHFTFDQNRTSEYDTDIGLEYEASEMYQHFREFYEDVVPELKAYGKIRQVRVCCNYEPHLRGNVYVEYKTEREALLAYRRFQGRWYGGKQLSVEFINIPKWNSAICGDFTRNRCPKGKSCNFLHVFHNPRNEFPLQSVESKVDSPRNVTSNRSWRWSETPDRFEKSVHRKEATDSDEYSRSSGRDSHKSKKENVNRRSKTRDGSRRSTRKRPRSRSRSRERKRHRK